MAYTKSWGKHFSCSFELTPQSPSHMTSCTFWQKIQSFSPWIGSSWISIFPPLTFCFSGLWPRQCTSWSFLKPSTSLFTFQISPPFNPMSLNTSTDYLSARYTSVCLILDTLVNLFFCWAFSFAQDSSESYRSIGMLLLGSKSNLLTLISISHLHDDIPSPWCTLSATSVTPLTS